MDPRKNAHGKKRMPSQFQEPVVNTDPVDAEFPLPYFRDSFFDGMGRGNPGGLKGSYSPSSALFNGLEDLPGIPQLGRDARDRAPASGRRFPAVCVRRGSDGLSMGRRIRRGGGETCHGAGCRLRGIRGEPIDESIAPRTFFRGQRIEEVRRGLVPGAWNEPRRYEVHALFAGQGSERGEHAMFHASAQGTATEEECIRFQGLILLLEDHRPDQAIVAETVLDLHGQTSESGPEEFAEFVLRPPDRGEVELIRSLSQLRYSRQTLWIRLDDIDLQLKALEEVFETLRSAPVLLPLQILSVQPGASGVCVGPSQMVENPYVIEKVAILLRIAGELKAKYFRTVPSHLRAFDGVVVDQSQALQAEIKLGGQRPDIFGFRKPVYALSHNMFAL